MSIDGLGLLEFGGAPRGRAASRSSTSNRVPLPIISWMALLVLGPERSVISNWSLTHADSAAATPDSASRARTLICLIMFMSEL